MRQVLIILFGGLFFSCSENEEITTDQCFSNFYAGSKDCKAQFIDMSASPALQTQPYNFDINGDLLTDLSFDPEMGGSPYRDWLHEDQILFYINVKVYLGLNCMICTNDSIVPDTLSYGQMFKDLKRWDRNNNGYIISSYKSISEYSQENGPVTKSYGSGTFYNIQHKYLLIKLASKIDTTLAWFNISCSSGGYMKINNYAFIKK